MSTESTSSSSQPIKKEFQGDPMSFRGSRSRGVMQRQDRRNEPAFVKEAYPSDLTYPKSVVRNISEQNLMRSIIAGKPLPKIEGDVIKVYHNNNFEVRAMGNDLYLPLYYVNDSICVYLPCLCDLMPLECYSIYFGWRKLEYNDGEMYAFPRNPLHITAIPGGFVDKGLANGFFMGRKDLKFDYLIVNMAKNMTRAYYLVAVEEFDNYNKYIVNCYVIITNDDEVFPFILATNVLINGFTGVGVCIPRSVRDAVKAYEREWSAFYRTEIDGDGKRTNKEVSVMTSYFQGPQMNIGKKVLMLEDEKGDDKEKEKEKVVNNELNTSQSIIKDGGDV